MLLELNLQEMNEVVGGVTREDYCKTLEFIIVHNEMSWTEDQVISAYDAWDTHCLELGWQYGN